MRASTARLRDKSPLCKPQALADLAIHALEAFPEECLGFINSKGDYGRLANVAVNPEQHAVASNRELLLLMAAGELRALCHSHPGGPDAPSEPDMRAQMEMEVPFILLSTNGQACTEPFAWGDELLDEEPLIGQSFRHGVTDCYALVRKYWRQELGVILPDYPRNWEWWQKDVPGEKDLYGRYFTEAGFYAISAHEVRPGDAWMAAIRSTVPNHAGVVLEHGLALHHPSSGKAYDPMRLSKRDPLARWIPYVTHWVRRD